MARTMIIRPICPDGSSRFPGSAGDPDAYRHVPAEDLRHDGQIRPWSYG